MAQTRDKMEQYEEAQKNKEVVAIVWSAMSWDAFETFAKYLAKQDEKVVKEFLKSPGKAIAGNYRKWTKPLFFSSKKDRHLK
jgi:hypothetical protein